MEVNVEKLSPVLMEFRIQVPADVVDSEVDAAYTELKRTARVKGFRKGKAPRSVLKKLYGPAVRQNVAERLMENYVNKAISEKSVQPLTQPSVESTGLKPKKAFAFKARFEVRPEIEKVEWKGLAANRPPVEVADEDVDAEIEKQRVAQATMQPVDRAAEAGDFATLKLTFTVAGEEKTEELDTEVGAGQLLPFLDEALPGMKAGETKEVEGAFPDSHQMKEIRGQKSTFGIELVELKERVLPEVDDEFAKDCEHEDLAAMKKAIREEIEQKRKQESDTVVAQQLVDDLCSKNPIPVPPSLVEQQKRARVRELQMYAQMTGQNPNDPAIQAHLNADSESKVRAGLLMAEIAKENDLQINDDDLERGYEEIAAERGQNVARIKAEYRNRQQREMLIGILLEEKVLNLIEGEATISDKAPEAAEPEAEAES